MAGTIPTSMTHESIERLANAVLANLSIESGRGLGEVLEDALLLLSKGCLQLLEENGKLQKDCDAVELDHRHPKAIPYEKT